MVERVHKSSVIGLLLMVANLVHAMSFDNRFFPLIDHPYITALQRPSHARLEFFVMTSHRAQGPFDDAVGIPTLFGSYDEQEIAKAIVALGFPNPLRTGLRGLDLPWNIEGKIQAQGVAFGCHQSIIDILSAGFTAFIMRVSSRHEFFFKKSDTYRITPSEEEELDEARRNMHAFLGLNGPNSRQIGMSDVDMYIRLGSEWDYTLKFRHIQTGLRLGLIAPAGERMDINNPASFPFGGNGSWGIYGAVDAEFELKEDWKVGALLRLNQRFAYTCTARMPAAKEPSIFGAIVGPVRVDPGLTFVFSPYVSFEHLRKGFGAQVQYTIIDHGKDVWTDLRPDKTPQSHLNNISELSRWGSDYITLNVFYDFGTVDTLCTLDPIVRFIWDFPLAWTVARASAKTQRISLGIECSF